MSVSGEIELAKGSIDMFQSAVDGRDKDGSLTGGT